MKKTTKILSVFMALLMVFSCVPMTAFAVDRDTSSLDAYLDNKNLAAVVETLLTDLNARKGDIVPTALNIAFQLVPDLKKQAEADKVEVMKATPEQLAASLIKYLDKVLVEADLNSKLPKEVVSILPLIGVKKLDLSSVDTILQALVELGAFVNKQKGFGDIYNLDVSPLVKKGTTAISSKDSALNVIYGLFNTIAAKKNIAIIKKAVSGKLSLGNLNGTIKTVANGLDVEATVNDLMNNLDKTIKGLLYDALIKTGDAPAYENSSYVDYTADELLAAALIKLIAGTDPTKAEATAAANMTLYQLIGTYADKAIAKFALEPLNTTVKEALVKLCDADPQLAVLKNILNLDYTVTVDTFNFSGMVNGEGIFENLNNLVCRVVKTIVQPSVYTELALKEGGNENITANLTSFFGYVLKTLAANNGGKLEFTIDGTAYSYDFSGFTADKIAGKSLEDMVVAVLKLFTPGWFGEETPATVDTLESLAVYAAYTAINKWMPDDFAKITGVSFDKAVSMDACVETIGTWGMDVACYWLNKATNFGFDAAKVASLKAKGWTWENFFDAIVDWALNYIKGIPAVADELDINADKIEDYGAWYKLNVILNEFAPLGFINGCGDETFTVDTYTLIVKKIAPSILNCDFAAFADVLAQNTNENNPMNKSVISAALGIIDNLVFAIFEHNCGKPVEFTKAATATQKGYEGTYDPTNGHYIKITKVIEPTGVDDPKPPIDDPKPPIDDPKPPIDDPKPPIDDPNPPVEDVIKGDLDGDGNVKVNDARIALRIAARIESATDAQIAAGDLNGSGKIEIAEARKILRVAAKIDKF